MPREVAFFQAAYVVSPSPLAAKNKAPSALPARIPQPEATRLRGWTAKENTMEQIPLFKPENQKRKYQPKEWKIVALRECPTPDQLQYCDTPDRAVEYWRMHIAPSPEFNPECECLVVILLNTRRRVRGHQLLTIGTMDTLLVHPREVFRAAVIAGAAAVVLMHNGRSPARFPSSLRPENVSGIKSTLCAHPPNPPAYRHNSRSSLPVLGCSF